MRRITLAASAASVTLLALAGPAQAAAPATTYVSQADIATTCSDTAPPPGWCTFLRDTGTASVGPGLDDGGDTTHLLLSTPLGNDKATVKDAEFAGQELSDLTALAYRFAVTSLGTSNAAQAPALNIEIDSNGPLVDGGYATLVFEPLYADQADPATAQPIALGQWQTRVAVNAAGAGGWWSPANKGVGALGFADYSSGFADVVAALPDATIYTVGVNQGGGNPGLASQVDQLVVGDRTFDFGSAPAPAPTTPTAPGQCKDAGWQTFDTPSFRNQGQCVSFVARRHAQ